MSDIKDNQTVKGLNTQLGKAKGEYESLKIQVKHLQKQSTLKKEEIQELEKKISYLEKPKELVVSEHAILRYFERVLGFNIEEIRTKLLDQQVRDCVEALGGNGTFPTKDNIKLIIRDKVVTTIID